MSDTRARLVAYAPTRIPWSTRCARWAADGRIPFAFVRCVSLTAFMDELQAGNVYAALVDVTALTAPAAAAIKAADVSLISVSGTAATADAHLPDGFRREELLHALVLLERPAQGATVVAGEPLVAARQVLAVIGSGGAGTSTLAGVFAQGLADAGASVLLSDLCRHASQAMLHDIKDQVDGLMEVALAADTGVAGRYLPHVAIPTRGYDLLLGMRQPLQWVALHDQRVAAVVSALTRGDGVLVCDLDPDLESQQDTGSVGVGDRHRLTSSMLHQATVVVLVVDASLVGVLRGVERCVAVAGHVDDAVPIIAVMNRQKKTDAVRLSARFNAAFKALNQRAGHTNRHITVVGMPLFAADRCHLSVARFPTRLAEKVTRPVRQALDGAA